MLRSTMDTSCGREPSSPGFSSLLADLVAEYADDASCRMANDCSLPQQQATVAEQYLIPVNQSTAVSQPLAGPVGGVTQPGTLAVDLHLALAGMDWAPQLPPSNSAQAAQHPGHATSPPLLAPPTFTPGLATQLVGAALKHGASSVAVSATATAAAAGSRRGRKPLPRLPDLQQQVDALTEQFQRLSQENSFLRGKLKLLECVVPYRDSHIGFLASVKSGQPESQLPQYRQQQQPSTAASPETTATLPAPTLTPTPAAAPAFAPVVTATASSDSSSLASSRTPSSAAADINIGPYPSAASAAGLPVASPSWSGLGVAPPPQPAPAAPVATLACGSTAHGALLGRGVPALLRNCSAGATAAKVEEAAMATTCQAVAHDPLRPPAQPPQAPTSAPPPPFGSWSTGPCVHLPGTSAVLALCPGPDGEVPPITAAAAEELRRVTPREFQLFYKHCVMQMAVLATAAEVHGPDSPQAARLERYLERVFTFMDQVLLLAPDSWVNSMYVNVETGMPERPSDEYWHTLGDSMALSAEQVEAVRMANLVHQSSVAPFAQERLQLASQLSATLAAAAGQQPVSSVGGVLQTLSEVDEVAERLRRNVMRQYQAQMDIESFLCCSVLSSIQVVRLMAGSYPYLPDGVAILHAYDPDRTPGGAGREGRDPPRGPPAGPSGPGAAGGGGGGA